MKKIGIVSAFDPHTDRKAHSGILFKINRSIEAAGFETVWVRNPKPFLYSILCKIIAVFQKIGLLKGLYLDHTVLGSKLLASTIDKKAIAGCDYLMVIHYFHVPAFLKTTVPIIYHSDATFELANDYYLHNIPRFLQKQANYIEQLALDHSAFHLSSSDWRQESVINTYHQNPDKCVVLEYGPCVDLDGMQTKGSEDGVLHLFFSGVDWERKGGDIAVETVKILNERGIKSVLTIAGVKEIPKRYENKSYINLVGYLNKNNKDQYQQLKKIYSTSDLFFLPTKAECSAIVFCEASACGLPIITFDTGGIGSYVKNGINGYRLPEGASPAMFADKIEEIINKNLLPTLSRGALTYAATNLNWDNWTEWFKKL